MQPRQPDAFRELKEAYQHRQFAYVVREGDVLAATLDADDRTRRFVPAVSMMKGAALAELDDYVDACRYLDYGLERFAADDGSHLRDLGGADWFALRLVELWMVLGRYGPAWQLLTSLEEPSKPDLTRLGAIRGRAALNTIRGDYEGAHHLLNAATTVVEKVHSEFFVAAVDADRAMVLATQGRLVEAVSLVDRTLERMGRPGSGGKGVWAAQATASVALPLSRLCVDAGNLADGERLLLTGTAAVERAPTTFLSAHVDLAIASLWRAQGAEGAAEPQCREAAQTFTRLGCRPSAAAATLELAKLAHSRGLPTSARPLLLQAREEFAYLGHARELRETEALLQRIA